MRSGRSSCGAWHESGACRRRCTSWRRAHSIGSVTQGLLTFTDPAAARNAVTVNSRNNATLAAAPCSTSRTHHAVSVNLSYAAPTVFWVRAFLRVVGRPVFASTTACATACTAAAWRVQPSMLWHHLC